MRLIAIALAVFCSIASAQQPQIRLPQIPQRGSYSTESQPLPENYILTLTISDKEQTITEMSLVTATPDFTTNFPDPNSSITTFTGTITPEDGGLVLIRYSIGAELAVPTNVGGMAQIQYKNVSTQASVRLRFNEPVQILKSDSRSYRLSISRLADQAPKAK